LMRTGEQPHQYAHQGHQRGRQIHRVIGDKIVRDLPPLACHQLYLPRIRTIFLNKDEDQRRSPVGANIVCFAPRICLGDDLWERNTW
jgi:hypothetical protein